MRSSLLPLIAALLLPAQAWASSCGMLEPTRAQLETPAGVAEYRAATTVSVVKFEAASQPPCFWIRLVRVFNSGAYARATCEATAHSQRYRLAVVEALKGAPPPTADAVFAAGKDPIDYEWLARRRPEVIWKRPSTLASGSPLGAGPGPSRDGHSDFAFLHSGRIGDAPVVVEGGACGDETIPFIVTYGGSLPHLVFQDARGRIMHWEPVDPRNDRLVQRMRRLRAGEMDVRDPISVRDFFARLRTASLYEVKWCGEHPRVRPAGGARNGRLDKLVYSHWVSSTATCRAGQRYLVTGGGWPEGRYLEEDAWPSVQLVPVNDGAIRTADIVTQLKIEGPETIPVGRALAWTD